MINPSFNHLKKSYSHKYIKLGNLNSTQIIGITVNKPKIILKGGNRDLSEKTAIA